MKKYDFVDRTLYLIRRELEEHLPIEATLDEMIEETKKIMKQLYGIKS